MLKEMAVQELQALLETDRAPVVLDVRENEEVATAAMPGAIHIPMGEIPQRLEELDPAAATVVVCHHGIRSARVGHYLKEQGFAHVANLTGGIDAWSLCIDPRIPRY